MHTDDMREAAKAAVKASGGGAALARQLNRERQAIYQWTRVPADLVLLVEKISGVSRHVLRPDLYPPNEPIADAPQPERAAS